MAKGNGHSKGRLPVPPLGGASQSVSRRRAPVRSLKPLDLADTPDELDELAKREWARLGAELAEHDQLASIDRNLFATYCATWSTWNQAQAQVTKLGLVVKSATGVPMQNPYLSIARATLKTLTAIGQHLGLSPAARGELRMSGPHAT